MKILFWPILGGGGANVSSAPSESAIGDDTMIYNVFSVNTNLFVRSKYRLSSQMVKLYTTGYHRYRGPLYPALRAAVVQWSSSWLAEQEVRGSIPGPAATISEIGYLLQSRDMAVISLKLRKTSK